MQAWINFNPLPPHGGRLGQACPYHPHDAISIHSLRMEGDRIADTSFIISDYFNPLPPHGGRLCTLYMTTADNYFNPLPPHGGRLSRSDCQKCLSHFNPLPPHGGRHYQPPDADDLIHISIHSLRMEGDRCGNYDKPAEINFNPLPPHGGRPPMSNIEFSKRIISIHSLRMEGDYSYIDYPSIIKKFQSTPSAWRETEYFDVDVSVISISIHSLRMEGDLLRLFLVLLLQEISIHSLRMEGDSKTAQESVFHFAYPCTILQKRMQKTTFCTRKNGFFRKKGEKFGAKPSASFCAPMIRTDTFPLNFSHRISGSSMSMVSFAPICSTFD